MRESKTAAALFSAALLALVLWPVRENWAAKPKDNFPLSYYPMFAKKRDVHYAVYHVVGYDADHNRYIIPYRYMGNGGFNQARRQVIKRCKSGKADRVAHRAARQLSRSASADLRKVVCIDVVRGEYHLLNFFEKRRQQPLEEAVLASASVNDKTNNP